MCDNARREMLSHLHVVARSHSFLFHRQEPLAHHFIFLWWLDGKTKVVMDTIQGGERVLVDDDLTNGPFLGFPGKPGRVKVDLHLRRLENN